MNPLRLRKVVVGHNRKCDGIPGLVASEVENAQIVGKKIRDKRLKAVEFRQGIVSQRNHEAYRQFVVVGGFGEFESKRSGRDIAWVIQKVFLELIEENHKVAVEAPGDILQRLSQCAVHGARLWRLSDTFQSLGDHSFQLRKRVTFPIVEVNDRNVGLGSCPVAKLPNNAGAQDRALAHAACAVKDGQARSKEVCNDDPLIVLPAKEKLRLLFRIRDKTDVGTVNPWIHWPGNSGSAGTDPT